MPNPYVNKVVQSNGTTLIDISDTTATASDVASGKYFYLATGEKVEGTASDEPTYETIVPLQTIDCSIALSNGAYGGYITNYSEYISDGQKYRVIFDDVEYTPLTATYYGSTTNYLYIGDINVEASSSATLTYPFEVMLYDGQTFYLGVKGSGSHTLQVDKITSEGSGGSSSSSGSSSWTLVASTSYQVSTTSTSATTVATWETGDSSIFTSDQILYVRIRDTAGKRAGYFYGTDNFIINPYIANGHTPSSSTSYYTGYRSVISYNDSGAFIMYSGTNSTGFGVYSDYIYGDGRIRIRQRYNTNYSLTIDGTYSVDVYLLTPPATIFE